MLGALEGWLKKIKSHSLTISLIALIVLLGLLLFHLGSAPSGFSHSEATYHESSSSISNIIKDSIYLPHKLVVWSFNYIGWKGPEPMRLVSIIYGAIFTICFYFLARGLFGKTVAILSTAIFSLTPLFIIASRQSTPDILLFAPVAIMAIYNWLIRTEKHKNLGWILLLVVFAIFMYVPGLIWWLAIGAVICRRKLSAVMTEVPSWVIVLGFWLFSIILIPAIISIIKDWHIFKEFALIPVHFGSVLEVLKHIAWMFGALIIKTPYHDQLIVGRAPLLDIIQIALVAFGGFAMFVAARSKAAILVAAVLFSVLAAGINNNLRLLALGLPAIGIFMAAGLRYLYIEWRGIFPRNPIPKTLALILMIIVVSVQSVYGLSYGLIAWPQAPATKHDYVLK